MLNQTIFGAFLFILAQSATAIVNLDNLHLGKNKPGFLGDFRLALSGASGNSQRFRINSAVNAQWNTTKNEQNRLYYLSFSYGYGESRGKEDQNKGFVHVRRIVSSAKSVAWELFSQVEHNKFARLNFRGLVGAGMRYNLRNAHRKQVTFLGLGGFFSREDITNSATASDSGVSNIPRLNIYLLERVSFSNNLSMFETLYFQPSVENVADYRLLNIFGVKAPLTKQFSLSFSIEHIFDNQPPQLVEKLDVNYLTAIKYQF